MSIRSESILSTHPNLVTILEDLNLYHPGGGGSCIDWKDRRVIKRGSGNTNWPFGQGDFRIKRKGDHIKRFFLSWISFFSGTSFWACWGCI